MSVRVANFPDECSEAVGRLRAAMIALYDSMGADPSSPQEVARQFGLNKTLTWNISRMISAPDNIAAVPHVPGGTSIERVLRAGTKAGAEASIVKDVRDAIRAFDKMIEIHVGDRATLDLIIDSMAPTTSDGLERSRKLAFRGNSGIYGVQARTRLQCCFLAPNAGDSTLLDMAMISGYVGFRRLRSEVEWPILQPRAWSDAAEPIVTAQWDPIKDPRNGDVARLGLLHSFERGEQPEIEARDGPEGMDYVLLPGPVGNAGAFDCYRGDVLRAAASRYRNGADDRGEFGASITTPAENLIFDLIVHKDLQFALEPEAIVFGRIFTHGQRTADRTDASALPIHQQPIPLNGSPPAISTPIVPRYREMVSAVTDQIGWNLADFRGVRLELKFPPLGATVIMRFPLPDRP